MHLARPRVTDANRKWWVLVAMTGSLSMILLDTTMVGVALPTIQRELNMATVALQWVANAYLLGLAAFVAVGGRLVDVVNPVRLFGGGVVVFALASAAAGAAPDGDLLIAARAVQGVGAAAMMPASLAIVVDAFPPAQRGRAVGLRVSVASVFLTVGPAVGGLLTQAVSWRAIFWVNLPLSAATLAVAWLARPDGARARAGVERLDRTGVLLLVPGLAAVVIALMQATTWGWGSVATIALLVGGGALLVGFIVRDLRSRDPLVDLRLFRTRALAVDGTVVFLIQFALVGLTVFGAILLQDLLGFSPVGAGIAILPTTLAITFVAPAAGRLFDRVGAARPLALGTAIAAAGLAWTGAVIDRLSYAWLVPGYIAVGLGIALTSGPANVDALTAVGPALRGQAAGLIQLLRQLGGVFGLAVIGTVVATIQHDRLSDSLAGAGVSPDRVQGLERILAEDPGSQRAIAADVTHGHVGAALRVARDAIVDAIGTAYYVAASVVVIAGVVVLVLHLLPGHDPAPPAAVGAR
jgi:EmrB/QacA subfamily drug resistance transporter